MDSHLVEDEDEVEPGPVEVTLDEVAVVVDSPEMEVVDTGEVVVATEAVEVDSEEAVDSVVVEVVDSLPQLPAVPPGGRCR